MLTYDLANIRLLLAEPNVTVRRQLEEALHEHGFHTIQSTGNLLAIRNAIEQGTVDLLVGDTILPEGNLSEVIRDVRHGVLGSNPFLVAITLASNPSLPMMRGIIDSGTDAVLTKPFTPEQLVDRIMQLIEKRKRFVVTSEYVGPDRRLQARPGTQVVQVFDVPNPLQCRAMGQVDPFRMKRMVESAAARINEQKVERDAYQIGYLVDRILPGLNGTGDKTEAREYLQHLAQVSRDIGRRIKSTRHLPAAAMCLSLIDLVDRVLTEFDAPHEDDLRHLEQLPGLIGRLVLPPGDQMRAPLENRCDAEESPPVTAS
ncbi:MAG: response regulator [Magnetospirillum sp. WYHS-4]